VKIFIEDFDKIVNSFQICKIVVSNVNTNAEVETGISSIDNLEVPKLESTENASLTTILKVLGINARNKKFNSIFKPR
jgi:hypothetical protein